MFDIIEFTVPGRAPATMSPNARKSWHQKHAAGTEYGDLVFCAAWCSIPSGFGHAWQRARVTVTQCAVRLRDGDNFLSSFKAGLDAIVRAGILMDDKPSCVEVITVKHQKVKHESEEKVVVRVERL